MKTMNFSSYEEANAYQLAKWTTGESLHNPLSPCGDENGECCPDFSCCSPENAWPLSKRLAFFMANDEDRLTMLLSSLADNVVTITAVEMEEPEEDSPVVEGATRGANAAFQNFCSCVECEAAKAEAEAKPEVKEEAEPEGKNYPSSGEVLRVCATVNTITVALTEPEQVDFCALAESGVERFLSIPKGVGPELFDIVGDSRTLLIAPSLPIYLQTVDFLIAHFGGLTFCDSSKILN